MSLRSTRSHFSHSLRKLYQSIPVDLETLLQTANSLACMQIVALSYMVVVFLRQYIKEALKVVVLSLGILVGLYVYTQHRSNQRHSQTVASLEVLLLKVLEQAKHLLAAVATTYRSL